MAQEKAMVTRKELEARIEEETWDTTMMVAIFTAVAFLLLLPIVQQAAATAQQALVSPRVPVLAQPLEAIASNVGAMWFQITVPRRPNELRMIAENSTGAFESMLLGLST
jgi:hypothetical protein